VCCLDVANGQPFWTFDLARHTQTRPQLLSSPSAVDMGERDRHCLLYLGTELRRGDESEAVLYCLRR
jgi:hypothetical protein